MRTMQLKITPPEWAQECRDGTPTRKTVSERKGAGEFSDAHYAAENYSPRVGPGVKRRNANQKNSLGTGGPGSAETELKIRKEKYVR